MSRKPLVMAGIAFGWAILVMGGVRFTEGALRFSERQVGSLQEARERLRRLEGWRSVESEVAARRDEVLGSFARSTESNLSWLMLAGLEHTAKEEQLAVMEIRPSSILRGQGQGQTLQLDVKLEGELGQAGRFLKRLPQAIPGVSLHNLQLVPREGSRVQLILRLQREAAW